MLREAARSTSGWALLGEETLVVESLGWSCALVEDRLELFAGDAAARSGAASPRGA